MVYKIKLPSEKHKQIALLNACGITYNNLEKEFGVSFSTIRKYKNRAQINDAYKKRTRDPNKNFKNALQIYNSTQDNFIKQNLEKYIFHPFIELTSDEYSNYGIYPSKIDNYIMLWHAIFGVEMERYIIKPEKGEVEQIALEEITKSPVSRKGLLGIIRKRLSEKHYYKPLPNDLKERMNNAINRLNEREKEVIIYRFGLGDGIPRRLEEIGKKFNISRERTRQIEIKALRRLRHPSHSRYIRDIGEEYFLYVHNFEEYTKRKESRSFLENPPELLELKDGKLEEKLSAPLSRLEFSLRVHNCFKEMGLNQVGDLVQKTEKELVIYRNFGKKSLEEVNAILTKIGLSLGMSNLPDYRNQQIQKETLEKFF